MVDVRPDRLVGEIVNAIQNYTDAVGAAIAVEVKETADAVIKDAREHSPVRTGAYKRGWTKKTQRAPGMAKYTVWNKKRYRLTHLLEFGHAKRGGGRVQGHPHLGPAYQRHGATMPDRIKRIIRNGG